LRELGKSATETLEMHREAFGEHSLTRTAIFERHSRSKAGRVSVEDDEGSGRASTRKTAENVEKVQELIHEDRRQTIHELADAVCQETLTENLNMRCIAAKFVTRQLRNDQNQRRVNVCLELREKANEDQTLICRIITGAESWIHCYDPETM
jgi:5-deoxy-D-glucuronate isomerase